MPRVPAAVRTLSLSSLARVGESFVCEDLKRRGFEVIDRNFRTRWGEIDVVARKGDLVLFVEVKTRRSFQRGRGVQAVTEGKLARILAIASVWRQRRKASGFRYRFDVAEVTQQGGSLDLRWFTNALQMDF